MAPTLEPAFVLRGYFSREHLIDVKTVKGGPQRMVVPISHGYLRGKDLDAELIPGGADCLLIDPENTVCHLDVRISFRTKEDHCFFVQYGGVLRIDEKSTGPLGWSRKKESTEFGDHEWFMTPVFETSDPNFKWTEGSVFVGQGRWIVHPTEVGVEYEIYHLRPGKP